MHLSLDITIGGISGVNGVFSTTGNISVVANGTITVNEPIASTNGGNVSVTGQGAPDVVIDANTYTSAGKGNVNVTAGQDILHTSSTFSTSLVTLTAVAVAFPELRFPRVTFPSARTVIRPLALETWAV